VLLALLTIDYRATLGAAPAGSSPPSKKAKVLSKQLFIKKQQVKRLKPSEEAVKLYVQC